jgi:hypothetical protein
MGWNDKYHIRSKWFQLIPLQLSILYFYIKTELFDVEINPVVLWKNAKVTEFNGRTLSLTKNSCIQINPIISEAIELKQWYALQNP